MLCSELYVQEPQEVVDLGERCNRALASATAGALLDSYCRRDAEDGVYVRPRGWLHELPRIGIQGLEISTLTFVEENIESER